MLESDSILPGKLYVSAYAMTPGSPCIVMVQFFDAGIGLRRDLSGSALP